MGNERRSIEAKLFAALFRRGNTCDVQSPRYQNAAKRMRRPFSAYSARRMFESRSGSVWLLRILGLIAAYAVHFMTFDLLLGAFSARWILIPLLSAFACVLSWKIQQGVISALRRRWKRPACWALASALALLLVASIANNSGIMVLQILLQVFIGAVGMYGGMRSRNGWELLLLILGFRSHLRRLSGAEVRKALRRDPLYFYHMLPYAEAMGFGRTFAKHFGGIKLEPCDWLQNAKRTPTTALGFYELYASIVATMRKEDKPNPLTIFIRGRHTRHKRASQRRARNYSTPRGAPVPVPEPVAQTPYVRPHRRIPPDPDV